MPRTACLSRLSLPVAPAHGVGAWAHGIAIAVQPCAVMVHRPRCGTAPDSCA